MIRALLVTMTTAFSGPHGDRDDGTYVQQAGHFRRVAPRTLLVLESKGNIVKILRRKRKTKKKERRERAGRHRSKERYKESLGGSRRRLRYPTDTAQTTHLTFLEHPLLGTLRAKLLNILEHVEDDVVHMHCKKAQTHPRVSDAIKPFSPRTERNEELGGGNTHRVLLQ